MHLQKISTNYKNYFVHSKTELQFFLFFDFIKVLFLTVLMSYFNFKFEYRCVICIYHIWIQRHLLKKSNLILGWQFFDFTKWGKMLLHTVQCSVEFTTATNLAKNYSYPITNSPFQRPCVIEQLWRYSIACKFSKIKVIKVLVLEFRTATIEGTTLFNR